jgi:hypothetical protein
MATKKTKRTKQLTEWRGLPHFKVEELAIKAALLDVALTGLFTYQDDEMLGETQRTHARIGIDQLLWEIRQGLTAASV